MDINIYFNMVEQNKKFIKLNISVTNRDPQKNEITKSVQLNQLATLRIQTVI